MEDKINEEFIQCACGAEILHLDEWPSGSVSLAVFSYGTAPRRSLRFRLRMIWKIITTGIPYCDVMIIDDNGWKKMKAFMESVFDK